MAMKFVLEIKMGNDAMQWPRDVAEAIAGALPKIADPGAVSEGSIRDENGNTVGSWEYRLSRPKKARR